MSEAELPEDFNQWPTDPFRLLGIPDDADTTAIRRAYTRLIRRFKPEHFPQHFIRIRQAYEAIGNLSKFAGPNPHLGGDQPRENSQSDIVPPSDLPNELANRIHELVRSSDTQDSRSHIAALWRIVAEGQFEKALQFIQSTNWSEFEYGQIAWAEYWITKLKSPRADSDVAAAVLLRNLQRWRGHDNAMAIAQVELKRHPAFFDQVDLASCLRWMLDVDGIQELLQLRWSAAMRVSSFQTIANDWKWLALEYYEQPRLRVVVQFTVIDFLTWSPEDEHQKLVAELISDLEATVGLDESRIESFDRLDQLRLLHSELEQFLQQFPKWKPVGDWVPLMWNDLAYEFASDASQWLVNVAYDCTQAVDFFDGLRLYEGLCQFLARQFEELIWQINRRAEPNEANRYQTLASYWQCGESSTRELALIEEFLSGYNDQPYDQFRVQVARFAIENNIMPQKITGYINNQTTVIAAFFQLEIADKIGQDRGLVLAIDLLRKLQF